MSIARVSAPSIAFDEYSSKVNPVPSPVAGSKSRTVSASPPVARTTGTVPLVRATGGLYDTVRNYDPATGEGTGFTFDDYTPEALLGTLRWALGVFPQRDAWRRLQQAGMRQDHSWDSSARAYVKIYERARGVN